MTDTDAAPIAAVDARRSAEDQRWSGRPAVLGSFLFGAAVSLVLSWRPSLWTDEAATISGASRSLSELYAMAQNIDAVHALYYAFMHVWLSVLPPEPFWLRLPSALAVGLAAAGTYLIARELASARTALLAAALFAVLPRSSWMGIEARPYAFSSLWAVVATLLIIRAHRQREGAPGLRRMWPVGYALVAALGVATHIYVALLVVGHGISLLLLPRTTWRFKLTWLGSAAAAALLAAPVVLTSAQQTGQLGGGDLGLGLWVRNVVVNQWFLGETPTFSTGANAGFEVAAQSAWKLASVVLALLCWSLVAIGLLAWRRAQPLLVWALPWVVVPTLVIGCYSMFVSNLYNPRYFSYTASGLALLLAHGTSAAVVLVARRGGGSPARARRQQLLAAAAVGLVLVAATPVYLSQRQVNAKSGTDWVQVAGFVARHKAPGQGVYFAPRYPITEPTVGQTTRGVAVAYPDAFEGLTDLTLLRTPVQEDNLTGTSRLLRDSATELAQVEAVWVVRRLDYRYKAEDHATLLAGGLELGRHWVGSLDEVVEYARAAS